MERVNPSSRQQTRYQHGQLSENWTRRRKLLEKFHYKAVIGYEDHGDYMEIFVVNLLDDQMYTMVTSHIRPENLRAWKEGSLIQNAMPKATRDEREMLMTGIDLDTWNREFNEEDQPNGQ